MAFFRWISSAFFGTIRINQDCPPSRTGRQAEAALICRTSGGIGQQIVPHAEEPGPGADSFESVPRLDWVADQPPDAKHRKRSKPEDLVGMTGKMNGIPYKIDSILGRGDNKVVFSLLNLETGSRTALAMFLRDFDPRHDLATYLESQRNNYDPDGVIEKCDLVLEEYPEDHIAAFNKGVALLAKHSFNEANAAFDIALVSSPQDLYTLLYNARALGELGKHFFALESLERASAVSIEGTREFLERFTTERESLLRSTQAVLKHKSGSQLARKLMATFFSGPPTNH